MELWKAIVGRLGGILSGLAATAVLYAACNALMDEYVTIAAGGSGAALGYWLASRGADGPLDDARTDDAFAWGFGALLGVLLMHTFAQGGLL